MIEALEKIQDFNLTQLEELAADIRQQIISVCLKNGGHLGASLGTVEIALALHRHFRSPAEPIIWDVGHQAYAHKLLTGRWSRFDTLRKFGGLSGFLSRAESEHDVFGAGHSSTSLSAAIAAAWTRRKTQSWTAAVIGDGGLTAGLALEALQQVRGLELGPLLFVINDNQMSISPNVGATPALLGGGRAAEYFDALGIDYVGPMDGHDLGQLLGFLEGLRKNYLGRPVALHVLTQKGRGYEPAEENPSGYHGISPLISGALPPSADLKKPKPLSYSEVFARQVCEWARRDPKVVAITAAMPEGTGLSLFAQEFPERFFDVGIAESHAITFAAGLAAQGWKPVVSIYSTFLQRGIDQLIHDVALQKLGVIIAVDRAGLVGPDGPTHHGSFDIAYTKMIPGAHVYAPASEASLKEIFVQLEARGIPDGPVFIRFPRGSAPLVLSENLFDDGEGCYWLQTGPLARTRGPGFNGTLASTKTWDPGVETLVISVGHSLPKVLKALGRMPDAFQALLVHVETIKPLSKKLLGLASDANSPRRVIVIEEGIRSGGFGESFASAWAERSSVSGDLPRFKLIAYPDRATPHGGLAEIDREAEVDEDTILRALGGV